MKKVACLAVVLAAILPVSAWAKCTVPEKPQKAPNGLKATGVEMRAARKANIEYQAEMDAFMRCLKTEYQDASAKDTTATEDQKKKMKDKWEKQNDDAFDTAQKVAEAFNEQLKACLGRADKCKN